MPNDPNFQIEVELGAKIPMRDGVNLSGTAYLPVGTAHPAPAILAMSPYGADICHDRAVYFASRGLPFLAVDVRGRGGSEGAFFPLLQEAKDGHDAVEWLAAQPWCNGDVAMWGGSYLGYAQWATAKEQPPHLKTIVPTAAAFPGLDFPMRRNILHPYVVQWLSYVSGKGVHTKLFGDSTYWAGVYERWYRSGTSFRSLGRDLGPLQPVFDEWLDHPNFDEYWERYVPGATEHTQVRLPVLTVTGHYDDDQIGALEYFRRHSQALGCAGSELPNFLVIGPWDHIGTGRPSAEFGGLRCGPDAVLDVLGLHLDWYAWHMLGGARPRFLQNNVSYYVIGADRWKYADSLEELGRTRLTLFLHSTQTARFSCASGRLRPEPGAPSCGRFTFDPARIPDAFVAADSRERDDRITNFAPEMELEQSLAVYESTPFEEDTEISGFFELDLCVSIDQQDADLYVTIYDVSPAGDTFRLSRDATRLRYSDDLATPRFLVPHEAKLCRFRGFPFVSKLVPRGHHLRLTVAPIGRTIGLPFTQRNFSTGSAVADETARDARQVEFTFNHGREEMSVLRVPLGGSASSESGDSNR